MTTDASPSASQSWLNPTRLAAINIAVAAAVMAIKYVAYLITGSVALYSDSMESIVNVMTAAAALYAIHIAAKPADTKHPFGHHKAEFFSAIFEGAMIIVAAILILMKAYDAFSTGVDIKNPGVGIGINAVASGINAIWAFFLINRGKAWRSPALVADGHHINTDVITSAGVLIALVLVFITGWTILDPLIAAAVAINILWTGYRITLESMSHLLDQAASPDIENAIYKIIATNGDGALQAHDIRTRQAGRALFIEFHLVVPGSMTVERAHEICDRLEHAIEAEMDGSEVVIHVEPDHKAKNTITEAGAIDL